VNPRVGLERWGREKFASQPLPGIESQSSSQVLKVALSLTKHRAMKTYWGWRYNATHS